MTYIRANIADIDAWEQLGNPGWNWANLFPYYKKSENYTLPTDMQLATGATYQPQYHGFDGPLHVGYPQLLTNGSFAQPIVESWSRLLPHSMDLNSGDTYGFSIGPQTLDRELDIRWDAARAYYHPVMHRPNLKIMQGTVKEIKWTPKTGTKPSGNGCNLVAKGVEYLTEDGKICFLEANKEVILSAGALRTPLVLESSGVGNPRILKSLGIQPKVDLPGVGENLQVVGAVVVDYEGDGSLEQPASAYHANAKVADLFGDDTAAIEASTRASIPAWAQAAVAQSVDGLDVTNVEKLLGIHHDLIFKHNVTAAEVLTVMATTTHYQSQGWALFPFSRGSVHLGDAEKINEPIIDPRLHLADFDLAIEMATGRFAQRFWQLEPISTYVTGPHAETPPPPNNATDVQWKSYIESRSKFPFCLLILSPPK